MAQEDVDWACNDCGDTWGAPEGERRPCPSCGGSNTHWMDYAPVDEEANEEEEDNE